MTSGDIIRSDAGAPAVRRATLRRLAVLLPALIFIGMAVLLGWGLTRNASDIPSALIGRPVPAFSLLPVKGRALGLSSADLRGEVSLVNVFASWCLACREEHPVFMHLAANGTVPLHGINYKDRPIDAELWLDTMGDPYTRTGADLNGRVAIDWGVYGVPETFVVSADGRIVYKHIGAVTQEALAKTCQPAKGRSTGTAAMKTLAVILFSALLAAALPASAAEAPQNFAVLDTPAAVPEISFADAAGQPKTLADYSGKVVLLNIWATWCAPCRKEMPTLDRLQAKLGGPDFEVVALSMDRKGPDAVKKFFAETGVTHLAPNIDTSAKAMFTLGAVGLPMTLLINRDGKEIGRLIGPAEWDAPDMVDFIRGRIAAK